MWLQALTGPNGYSQEWNDALGDAQCPSANVTICAYDATDNTQVKHRMCDTGTIPCPRSLHAAHDLALPA